MFRWYEPRPTRQLLNLSRSGVLAMVMLAAGCTVEKGSHPESASAPHPEDPGLDIIGAAEPPADLLQVDVQNHVVTIHASGVPLIEILERLAEHSGMQLVNTVHLEEPVDIKIDRLPLYLAVDVLLQDHNYSLMSYFQPGLTMENFILTVLSPSQAGNVIPLRGLTDADHARRFRAVTNLADLEQEIRGPWLNLAYQDSSSVVRAEVIDTIASSEDRSAIALVERALSDPTRLVRAQAIAALSEIGDERSVSALARMLDSEDPDLHEEVLLALASIGGTEAIEVLITMLEDSNGDVRETATEVLADLPENHE